MGWHYILTLSCTIIPEFIPFIEKRYLDELYDSANDIHYVDTPYRQYDSDDDCEGAIEERERIAEWAKEEEEEKEQMEKEYEGLSTHYKALIDIWRTLNIGSHFYEYTFEDGVFHCKISKKVNWHSGDLKDDYETFLKDIIVPISSEIWDCQIESDDFGDCIWHYTDSQLRNIYFRLQDKVKSIEHTYDANGSEIVETRVVYKYPIKKIQLLDLNRAYTK